MNWLISANSNIYDHATSFLHFGHIDWRQGKTKYAVGDIVYIYCSSPVKRIKYKCRVTEINKKFSSIRDDRDYWLDVSEYTKALDGMFLNLELIEEVDTDKLSLYELMKYGLKAAPQGPKKLDRKLETYINSTFSLVNNSFFPDNLDEAQNIYEGMKKKITVNKYERSPLARQKCIEKYGAICNICSFDFEKVYGELGKNFIHVHHITPLSTIKDSYKVDLEKDLIPVCPNCHAMLHRTSNGDNISIERLKNIVLKG